MEFVKRSSRNLKRMEPNSRKEIHAVKEFRQTHSQLGDLLSVRNQVYDKKLFPFCRRSVEPHGFIPCAFFFFNVILICRTDDDVNPELAVGKIHQHDQS
jgi:hypothetical protein